MLFFFNGSAIKEGGVKGRAINEKEHVLKLFFRRPLSSRVGVKALMVP